MVGYNADKVLEINPIAYFQRNTGTDIKHARTGYNRFKATSLVFRLERNRLFWSYDVNSTLQSILFRTLFIIHLMLIIFDASFG